MRFYPAHILFVFICASAFLTGCKSGEGAQSGAAVADSPLTDSVLNAAEEKIFLMAFYDGLRAKILDNHQEARKSFEKALEINPGSGATHYEMAQIHLAENRIDRAIFHAEKAYASDKNNPWYGEALAMLYGETGRWDDGIAVMRDMIERHPENRENHYRLANLMSARKKYGDALEVLDKVEENFGPSEDLSMQRQMIYLEQEKYDLALAEVDRLIDINPSELRYLGIKAEILEKAGRRKEAMALYETMLEMDPGNGYVLLALYEDARNAGDQERAEEYLGGAFASNELNIDLKINIFLNLMSATGPNSDHSALLGYADILRDTHPENPKTYAIRGDLFFGLNRLEESRENFRRAVELDPNRPPIWQQILTIDSRLQDFEAMKEESDEAILLFPMQPVYYMFNGVALLQMKKPEEAVSVLNSGKNLVVDDDRLLAQFLSSLGDAYHAMNEHAKSDQSYNEALKLNPNNVVVLNNYAYYLALRGENLEKAEQMAKKANDLHPDEPGFQDTYAWVLFKRNNHRNALFWIEEALKNGGDKDPVILEHHGDILEALGMIDRAMEAWNAALERGGDRQELTERISKHKNSDK